ncbi:MAG: amidohydrolase [Acidobacteria bacterium]|nr:amidohydrolase [Acidobacteriota bacterium]
MKTLLALLFLCAAYQALPTHPVATALGTESSADLVLLNGKIWTVNERQQEAEAVAVVGNRIAAAGSTKDIRRWIGSQTKVIDLQGKRVVPGFNDAHVHFVDGGAGLASVQLRDAGSQEEFRKRIGEFAAKLPKGRWVLNGNWDHENWRPASLPTRQLIDAVTQDNPVFINRLDGHMALANSLALKLAGITRDTKDPDGGTIVRDASGEPTGVLKDAAMNFVYKVIPDPTEAEMIESVKAAMRYAAENGVTSVQDMSASPDVLGVYQTLLARGELSVRISGHQPLAAWQRLAAVGVRASFGNDKLKIGGLKGFADGSLGSTTALLFAPYLDDPKTSGLPSDEMFPESKMRDRIIGADKAGLQIAIHAIGDKANKTILDFFAEAEKQNGARDRRFRIEHAQHLRPEEIKQFASQRVIASMQPYHAIDDGRWAENRIGAERAKGTYAFRSLIDAGAVLAFGSDWFVAPMEPLMGIYAAVTRRTLDGKRPGGWVPEQKITVAEAVKAFTLGSAFASFDEKVKGSIEVGKLADFAVLSADIFKINPIEIEKAKVAMTIFDGKLIYEHR